MLYQTAETGTFLGTLGRLSLLYREMNRQVTFLKDRAASPSPSLERPEGRREAGLQLCVAADRL